MVEVGITLTFSPTPQQGASPAVVSATARQIVSGLHRQHQRIEPVYDGSRGGDVYQWLVEAAQAAQPLIPLASLALMLAQLMNELKN